MKKQQFDPIEDQDKIAVRQKISPPLDEETRSALKNIVGTSGLFDSFPDRLSYCRDRLPLTTFRLRSGKIPASLPCAIVQPKSEDELTRVLTFANNRNLAVIPYGAGSGVLGGAISICGEIIIDLKKFVAAPIIDFENCMVTVPAGVNGGVFEEFLNNAGYTCGHHPQSLFMSTVGGWIACRGAGQMSSRYGKIEDMVLGIRAILPNGKILDIKPVSRRAVGPGVMDFLVGSEGTIAILTQATLKIWKLPENRLPSVVAFPTLDDGLNAMREIMQSDIRPSVARLYDEHESQEKAHDSVDLSTNPIMCILEFVGSPPLVEVEASIGLKICRQHSAIILGNESFSKWQESRFNSYSAKFHAEGGYVETIEVTGLWSKIPMLYAAIKLEIQKLDRRILFGAHWSHIYAEGACQYMTFKIPDLGDEATALELHLSIWRTVQELTLEHGAAIAHHHGVGLFRTPWIEKELGGGLEVIEAVKRGLDPNNILNPGKIGLRLRPGSVVPISTKI
jgi:alkyldihydroxyacetonephosphate synthase